MNTKHLVAGLLLFGSISLHAQTTSAVEGANKTGYGLQNGALQASGTGSTFIGAQAGAVNTGSYNSFLGNLAGLSNTSGVYNTFMGYQTGRLNVSGNYNTYLGSGAGRGATGSSNVFLGYNAGFTETGSNLLYINNSSATTPLIWGNFSNGYTKLKTRLGINMGADEPRATLDVNGKVMIPLASGVDNESAALTMTAADDFLYKTKYLNTYGYGFYQDENAAPFTYASGYWGIDFFTNQEKKMKLNNSGQLLIGLGEANAPTTAGSVNVAAYKLFVKGGILTEEVRINLQSSWADYVFANDYKLPSLNEVENYISENGHLPNVPSAAQIKEEGIAIGEMTKIQQEKIEELTLYAIDQNKQIEAQKLELEKQREELNELKAAIKTLISKQ